LDPLGIGRFLIFLAHIKTKKFQHTKKLNKLLKRK
jgi:hypothetical protein